jgi:hypothetical protein
METNKQKAIVLLIVVILIACIPLVVAAPVGVSESAVVKAAKSWIGVLTPYMVAMIDRALIALT